MEIIDQELDDPTEQKVQLERRHWKDDSWTVGTFIWTVKNFSRWFELREGPLRSRIQDMLISPLFTFDRFKGSWWYSVLWIKDEGSDICFGINRLETNIQEEKIEAEIEFSFLAVDGSILIRKRAQKSFSGEADFVFESFFREDELLVKRKDEFLPNDTLTVCCRIWKISNQIENPVVCFGQSEILLENGSSIFCVEGFSSLKDGQKHYFDVGCNTLTISPWKISIYLNDDGDDVQVEVVASSDKESKRVMFEISAIDTTGNIFDSSTSDFDIQKGTFCLFSPFLTKSKVIADESKYLPNDTLILRCRHTIVYTNKIEYGRQFSKSLESHRSVVRELRCRNENNTSAISMSLVRDLIDIYENKTLSDVNIRVGTENFPAHKLILSARSPVFRTKFTTHMEKNTIVMKEKNATDMKEKNATNMTKDTTDMNRKDATDRKKNTIDIDMSDFDADTVQRMLEYMYTDVVEDLQWNTATGLYMAADKYQLLFLKDTCLEFLKANLSTLNFCEALLFADMYQDDDLKNEIQDFLVRHDNEIIYSEEWNSLKANHKQLAYETIEFLYLKKLERE